MYEEQHLEELRPVSDKIHTSRSRRKMVPKSTSDHSHSNISNTGNFKMNSGWLFFSCDRLFLHL